jgi:hypothetical protein
MSRLLPTLAVAAAVCAAPAATAHAADLAEEPRPTSVTSVFDVLAWSHFDGSGYRLGTSRGPVGEPRRVPYGADLGTNRAGRPYAVFTRCAPGCDLVRMRLDTGAQQVVTKLSAPDADEHQPTIHLGRIAFVRREGRSWSLRTGDTTSGSRGSRLRVKVPARSARIVDPQLGMGVLAYTVVTGSVREVRVLTLRTGRDRVVLRVRGRSVQTLRPSWAGNERHLYLAVIGGRGGNRFVRWSAGTGRLAFAPAPAALHSASWVGGDAGMLIAEERPGAWPVRTTGPPAFRS